MSKKQELIKSIEDVINNDLQDLMTHEDDFSLFVIMDGETGEGTGSFNGSIADLVQMLVSEPEMLETFSTACLLSKAFLEAEDKEGE